MAVGSAASVVPCNFQHLPSARHRVYTQHAAAAHCMLETSVAFAMLLPLRPCVRAYVYARLLPSTPLLSHTHCPGLAHELPAPLHAR